MKLPMQAAGRRSTFFEEEALDHLVTMVMELSTELWIARERLFALESVLSRKDESLLPAMEKWEASKVERTQLETMRQKMLGEMFRTLGVQRAGPSEDAVVEMAS